MIERGPIPTESVSVKTVDLTESTKITEDTIMEISIEVFKIIKLLLDNLITIQDKFPSKRRLKRIRTMERQVNKLFHDIIKYKDTRYNDEIFLGLAYLLIFWIYDKILNYDESVNYGRVYLTRCLELLKGKELDHTVILLAIRVLNYLGNTYINSDKVEDSVAIFEKAIELYLKYTKEKDTNLMPFNILVIFDFEENKTSKILLEEIYIAVLKKLMKACDIIFQRDECTLILWKLKYLNQQLMFIPLTIEYLKFITELLSISEYFLLHNHFTKARSCLAAAYWMSIRFYHKKCQKDDAEKFSGEKDMLNIAYQNIDKKLTRYWGKYGLALLRLSAERLLQSKEENKSLETSNLKLESLTKFNEQCNELTLFADIKKDLKPYTGLITDEYLTHYADAKYVFNLVIYWFDKAKAYYTPDKNKILYVTIVQDISKAYKYFAYYEQDLEELTKLHLMRIRILDSVSKILDKRHDYNILKQIWIELAIIYSTLMDILTRTCRIHGILATLASHLDHFAMLSIHNLLLYLN